MSTPDGPSAAHMEEAKRSARAAGRPCYLVPHNDRPGWWLIWTGALDHPDRYEVAPDGKVTEWWNGEVAAETWTETPPPPTATESRKSTMPRHYTRSDILRLALDEIPVNLEDELDDGSPMPFEDLYKNVLIKLEEGDTAWYPTPRKLRPATVLEGPGWACYYLRGDEELGVLGTGEGAPHRDERAKLRHVLHCDGSGHHEEVCEMGAIIAEQRIGIAEIYLVEIPGFGFQVLAFHVDGVSERLNSGDLDEMVSVYQRRTIQAFDGSRSYGYDTVI